jgi:NAD(P)-dependent dehydrogenase (short-subunit alcohol dehydrogenase family)
MGRSHAVALAEATGMRCLTAKLSTADRGALEQFGVIGLTKVAARDLAGHGITVNAVAPGNVEAPMTFNDALFGAMRPDLEQPTLADVESVFASLHLQPVPFLKPAEITRAVMFLAHPDSTHITGTVLPVDAGATARFTG